MPKPKKNESKQDFLGRCTREVIEKEGKESDQAYAMCNAFWDEAKSTRNTLSLTAPFQFAKKEGGEAEKKSFMITAYTGQVLDLGWFGKFVFALKGMKAKEKFPVLREHMRDRVVGIADRTWKDEKNFYIGGEFVESTKDGAEVLDLAEKGFPWQASVGIWPEVIRSLKDEKEKAEVNGMEITGPAEIWLESRVGEVSFVSLGADDNTAAIVLSDQSVPVEIITNKVKQEEHTMTKDELKKQYPEIVADIQAEAREAALGEGREQGVTAERDRVKAILEVKGDAEVTTRAITEGITAEASYKLFFDKEKSLRLERLAELEAQAPAPVGQGNTEPAGTGNLTPEEQWKATWEKDAKLRTEFDGDYETYLAYERNMAAGRVRVITKR